MSWNGERLARAGLCAVAPLANPQLASLVVQYGAEEIWNRLLSGDSDTALARRVKNTDLDQIVAATKQTASRFLIPGDESWPTKLADLDRCEAVSNMVGEPFGLWTLGPGEIADWSEKAITIVGARACTSYGERVAFDLAYELANGYTVISGGAYGIDVKAHQGALAAGGKTIAVLANGVDQIYPRGNTETLLKIREQGLILSELPPGANPTRAGFLARNRLVAALSKATLIVEASVRSGARNTANWALAMGRELLAVPGEITSGCSYTPNQLIHDGAAILVASTTDVLSVIAPLGDTPEQSLFGEETLFDQLSESEMAIRDCIPARSKRSVGEISLITGIEVPNCISSLTRMEILGLVKQTADNRWRISKPS